MEEGQLSEVEAEVVELVVMREEDWHHAREREREGETHPCDAWKPDDCMCKGSCSCHFIQYKLRRRTAEVFDFCIGYEHAVFTIDQEPGCRRFGLSIEGSFGGYAFSWTHPGGDFKRFLAGLDCSYVLGKMVGRDEVFDGQATADAIRKEIWQARRAGAGRRTTDYFGDGMDAETARAEWDSVPSAFESEVDFDHWQGDTEFFKNDEPWRFYQTCPGARANDFRRLYELFWPVFRAELLTNG